jgi:haloacetate dehalogenase
MGLDAFATRRIAVDRTDYLVRVGGAGPPVLLLHGFPQTHRCWEQLAPHFLATHTVVLADLRGYGASVAPPGGPLGEGYTKREMAAELVAVMAALRHDRFAVVGHDRGARVAYRMALDHPRIVTRLAVLNVIPTVDQFAQMSTGTSLGYWPWFLLAQPAPLPERLLIADPDAILDHVFDTWPADPAAIGAEHRAAYREALTPAVAAAMCGDYRASFHLDRQHDAADLAAGTRIHAPTLVVTGADETQLADAPAVWSRWATQVTSATVPGGHFVPEESPDDLLHVLGPFLTD